MAERLLKTLEQVNFHYTEEVEQDIQIIESISQNDENKRPLMQEEKKQSIIDKGKDKLSSLFKKSAKKDDEYEKLKKLKELLYMNAITQEEYDLKKKQILGL